MSVKTVAFFNNKGGVGKTTLVYNLAWMYASTGKRVVAVDLDPQANLSSSFLDEERLEEIWAPHSGFQTIYRCIRPIISGIGDIGTPTLERFDSQLALVAGDLGLSEFEDDLSSVWAECLDRKERAFRVTSAFWRIIQRSAEDHNADIVLIDLGPNLGSINRSALIAADFVVVPLAADLYSLQGLHNLGPKLRAWRDGWHERLEKNPIPEVPMPSGNMLPLGYIVMQHSVRLDKPAKSYEKWMARIPAAFHGDVLGEDEEPLYGVQDDPKCLALIKHYRSLMAMAHESRKPVFKLRSADGAIGSHFTAAQRAGDDFRELVECINTEIELVQAHGGNAP
jgi:cellulose biosynthesis protein BcsQ